MSKQKKQIKKLAALLVAIAVLISAQAQQPGAVRQTTGIDEAVLPPHFAKAVEDIRYDWLGKEKGESQVKVIDDHTVHVKILFSCRETVRQDDWQIAVRPAFTPSFHWAPHLAPTDRNVIDRHVFRSPALIVADRHRGLMFIPDLDILAKDTPVGWYLDLDAPENRLTLGMSNTRVSDHVLFEREAGAAYPPGEIEIGFYLFCFGGDEFLHNPFRKALDFFWKRWGHDLYKAGNPLKGDLEPYVRHTYNWAFDTWAKNVWQEFQLNGKRVGAPVFIVNVTQSPNYRGEVDEREFRSVWNQAWFSSLRSASGLFRYARRTNNSALMEKARLTKELALSFPQVNGFFYALIGTEMEEVEIDGRKYKRSKGWDTHYWGNSNRNPYTSDPRRSPFHILDMSWTALLMLRWYDELERDERLLQYAENYAQALMKLQSPGGFFPAWLSLDKLRPMEHLNRSPETSLSVTFLLKLHELTGKQKYKEAALKAMEAVIREVIPTGRWEDFETYWSCSRYGSQELVGKKVPRNNLHKQNNLSMFWTAEALLACYETTKRKEYLRYGRRTLDEMLMTQASWQPPYMYVKVLGGFGVLNADGEWNDSRQSLFAELILRYGKLLREPEYTERGYAALRASFVMMYCPENPSTRKHWEKVYPFFGPEDYGFTMENYGHGGRTSPDGEGMGEFTIYDWGNGAAAEAYNRILDTFGKIG